MEQFVLGIFQEQLSKFIVGFRKEQVNANLLNGKGEITDVSLNCPVINDLLATVTPYVELESVHVSKLSFHVTAWANLRKAPILVDIEDVHVKIVEPLHHLDRTKRRRLQQITQAQLTELIHKGLHKLRGSYNLFDRILDNLTIEIRSVHVSFQPRGKFKTKRPGPWTPPSVETTMRHIRYVSVNEFGEEASPEEVWRHNKHPHGQPAHLRTLLIYKKMSMQCSLGLKSFSGDKCEYHSVLKEAQVEVHLCFRKRLRDAAILAIQFDATLLRVDINVDSKAVPMLAHAIAGMSYCLAKDRAYDDPLLLHTSTEQVEVSVTEEGDDSKAIREVIAEGNSEDAGEDENSAEGDDAPSAASDDDLSSINDEDGDTTSIDESMHSNKASSKHSFYGGNRPCILLPNGLVIHERITLTVSVHHCTARGVYPKKTDGHVQFVAKGLIAEAMWPKASGEKGGYAQASLAYMSIQERHGPRIRSIVIGGIQHDVNHSPLEKPGKSLPEKISDENFPLFEDRCIRNDPIGLRHTFPAQAFGLKTTASFIDKVSSPGEEEIMVIQEIGIDQFDVLLDAEAWCRALRFLMNEDGGGFDPRWHSGDWTELLTTDMLVAPSQPLNLEDHIQPTKEIFLDENYMISSDLLNVTARITNVEVRIPAAVHQDVRSCDLIINLSETMIVVSSALPRTFLSGKIGTSIRGDESKRDVRIEFPNDASDICYTLEEAEDPSMRQRGTMTSRAISTFRAQLTMRGFSIRIIPAIPFCNATEPQNLLEPMEMTMIACFEGEPPTSPDSNLITIALILSVQIHRLGINCDFDVIVGAVSTLLSHSTVAKQTFEDLQRLDEPTSDSEDIKSVDATSDQVTVDGRIRSSVVGRRILVRRQLQRSRETGGLSVAFCMQVAELDFVLWRQNVCRFSRFRASLDTGRISEIDETPIALLKLMSVQMKNLEAGLDFLIRNQTRRVVLKGCLAEIVWTICNFDTVCTNQKEKAPSTEQEGHSPVEEVNTNSAHHFDDTHCMIEVLSFGAEEGNLIMRAEEQLDSSSRAVALSADIDSGGAVHLQINEFETVLLLIVEALLMPTGMKHHPSIEATDEVQIPFLFPERSVGSVIISLVPTDVLRFEQSAVEVLRAVDGITNDADTGEIDRIMFSLKTRFLPDVTDMMLSLRVSDSLVFLPNTSQSLSIEPRANWVALFIKQATIRSAYFEQAEIGAKPIMDVFASGGTPWSILFTERSPGFQHFLQSNQSLHSARPMKGHGKVTGTLVPEFVLSGSYRASEISLNFGESPLSVTDINKMKDTYDVAKSLLHRCLAIERKISGILEALRLRNRPRGESVIHLTDTETGSHEITAPKEGHPYEDAAVALKSGRASLARLRELLERNDKHQRTALQQKQREVDTLRYSVFSKERERVAAISLVGSQLTGWLRMGGTHMFGQRSPKVTSMWRYFAVLRKSLLILYTAPGDSKPIDIVVLEGARLHPLAGGRRKRDVSRGFSVVENGGIVRFFLAESGGEYETWIRELQKAMNLQIGSIQDSGKDSQPNEWADGTDESVKSSRLRSFSSDTGADYDESTSPRRGKQVRQRFSKITASTKNRVGSAVQAARQRRRTETEHDHTHDDSLAATSTHAEDSQNSETDLIHSLSVANDATEAIPALDTVSANVITHSEANSVVSNSETSGVPTLLSCHSSGVDSHENFEANDHASEGRRAKLGQRFGAIRSGAKNKLGSAVQAAKGANEQRKKRRDRQQQLFDSVPSQSNVSVEASNHPSSGGPSLDSDIKLTDVSVANTEGLSQDQGTHEAPGPSTELGASADVNLTAATQSADMDQLAEEASRLEEDVFDESNQNAPNGRFKIRQRVSKIGSTVRSVRRGQSQRAQDDELNTRRSVAERPADSSELKLKAIRVGAGHPAEEIGERGMPLRETPLKRIDGFWIVEVVCEDVEVKVDQAVGLSQPVLDVNEAATDTVEKEGDGANGQEALEESIDGTTQESEAVADMGDEEVRSSDEQRAFEESIDGTHSTEKESTVSLVPRQKANEFRLDKGFRIRVLHQRSPSLTSVNTSKDAFTEVVRTYSDVLALHSIVSEKVAETLLQASLKADENSQGEDNHINSVLLGLSPLEMLRCTGSRLGGLMNTLSSDLQDAERSYQCEILAEFLNSILGCPLPVEACDIVTHFLSIPSSTDDVGSPVELDQYGISREPWRYQEAGTDDMPMSKYIESIEMLHTACETELLRAELCWNSSRQQGHQVPRANDILDRASLVGQLPQPYVEPLLPDKIMETLHEAMHESLMNVMVERDEAHAQLVGASVLHVHEMEQERKKVERLSHQLRVAEKNLAERNTAAAPQPFFLGRSLHGKQDAPKKDQDTSPSKTMKKFDEKMQQSSEDELMALCQQLANEIQTRTSASLEIIRLKESRNIERENERKEKEALQEELRRCKDLLAAAEKKD